MYGSWDMEHNRQNFYLFWTTFCPFTLSTPSAYGPRKSKFWKNKQHTWKYYHFTYVYHKWQSYEVWFLRYEVQQTEFFVILDRFLPFYSSPSSSPPFYPPNNPKYQNFEKIKQSPGDIIILHMCTINYDHMMYGSWYIEHEEQNFLSFWTNFLPIYPLKAEKSRFWKNEKNAWR